jgi:hypothetical protein
VRAGLGLAFALGLLVAVVAGWPSPVAWAQAAFTGRVEIRADARGDAGRLLLVWPGPTKVELVGVGPAVRLRSSRPLSGDVAAAVRQLSRWLTAMTPTGRPGELTLRLRDGVGARLEQPHPRLTVVELNPLPAGPPRSRAEAPGPASPAQRNAAGAPRPLTAADQASLDRGPESRRLAPVPVPRPVPPPLPTTAIPESADSAKRSPGAPPDTDHPGPALRVVLAAEAAADRLELRFGWEGVVPAAVFVRGGVLWALFGAGHVRSEGWPALARPEVAAWLDPLASESLGGAHAFRFALRRPARVAASLDGADWRLRLQDPGREPPPGGTGAGLVRGPEEGTLASEAGGLVADVTDPVTGGRLGVLLSPVVGVRQAGPVRLVDLELLPTAQGLAWRPLADGVVASVEGRRFTLTRLGGLRLSAVEPTGEAAQAAPDAAPGRPAEAEPVPPEQVGNQTSDAHDGHAAAQPAGAGSGLPAAPIGLSALGHTDAQARQQARRDLLGRIPSLSGLPRALARIELAKLYLADALGPEARTALELVDAKGLAEPAVAALRPSRTALTGAATALAGRHDAALAMLLDHTLDADTEVALWRSLAASRGARWDLATQEWARADGLLDGYPTPLRRLLGLEMATALLEGGESGAALAVVEKLRPLEFGAEVRARLDLLEGMAFARAGRAEDAERAFGQAEAGGDDDTRTRAAFLLASAREERGSIAPDAAARALEAQRPQWRGHPWETRMLRRLAELQDEAGLPEDALDTRRTALERTRDPAAAATITAELRARLHGLLEDGGAPRLPAIAALALHRTYGHLLGGDAAAARVRVRLAASATEAGLLETAAALLDAAAPADLPAGTLERANADLAAAQAAAGDLQGALARLGDAARHGGDAPGDGRGLPALLRARAALARGDSAEAMAALGPERGDEAGRLRRAAQLQAGDWAGIAGTSGAALESGGDDARASSEGRGDTAAWLGVAYLGLDRPADAAALADRVGLELGDGTTRAILELAGAAYLPGTPTAELPAAVGALAAALRAKLAKLPPLAGDDGGDRPSPVRSAAERSSPAG